MRVILIFCLLFASMAVFSQSTESSTSDSSNVKSSSLTVGTTFGNNMSYYGQSLTSKVPYGSFNLSYSHRSGFWANASVIRLLSSLVPSGISETDLAAGYDFGISKKLDASLSYTRFIFPNDSPLPQSVNPNTVSLGLSYKSKIINTSLYNDFVFGNQQSDLFSTFGASREFELGSINKKKDYIAFGPSFSITGATQHLMDTISSGKGSAPGAFDPLGNLRGKKARKLLPRLSPQEAPQTVSSTKFSYLATTLNFPLSYNRAHYSVETAFLVSFLNKEFNEKPQSFFTLSFNYYFFKD